MQWEAEETSSQQKEFDSCSDQFEESSGGTKKLMSNYDDDSDNIGSQSSFQHDMYLCPECGKGFNGSENYTIQELVRNNMIACDICNRFYHLFCCSEIYNENQTGNFYEMVEHVFRNSLKSNYTTVNNCNFNLEIELKKIENKVQLLPFFVCNHCTETRQLYSTIENINLKSKLTYYADDVHDPFLFYERYLIDNENDIYYVISKANNENLINKFSYSNYLATREDSRFLPVSKVTLVNINEYSTDLLESSIENTFQRFNTPTYENNSNKQLISADNYKYIGMDVIKQTAENSNVRPDVEVYTLLKVDNVQNQCECIGYFTCSIILHCNQSKRKEIAACHCILRQLFISETFRKKGHAQKMVRFFFTLSNLVQTISNSENYRFFSKTNCVEYPNYSMCCLLSKLTEKNNSTEQVTIQFDWNNILDIKEQMKYKKEKQFKKRKTDISINRDSNPPNIEKRKFQIQYLIKERLDDLEIEFQSKKLMVFIFKKTNLSWRAEVFIPLGQLDFDIVDDKEMKIQFEW